MDNEEQRRAFADYMGTTNSQAHAQAQAQAQPGQQYFYPVAPPAAPTPPPAAPSSVAGQYPGFYMPPRPPGGYVPLPRGYTAPVSPAAAAYAVGWQYTDPMAPANNALQQTQTQSQTQMLQPDAQDTNPYTFLQRTASGDLVEAKIREQYYRYAYPPPDVVPTEPPKPEPMTFLHCHTCSECGSVRSAAFHRRHPIVPGRSLVSTPCRRCKKAKVEQRSTRRLTHIRSCTADEPCDWPDDSIHIEIERDEPRGRGHSRDKISIEEYRSSSRPRVLRRSESRTNLGLRILQQDRSPVRERASRSEVFPPPDIGFSHASRYAETSPPPDVVPRRKRYVEIVDPPPDIVPLRSSRVVELPPSPPPVRRSSTKVYIRSESEERNPHPRARSVSPVYHQRPPGDAERKLAEHPRAFRPVHPVQQQPLSDSEDSTAPRESPPRGILKRVIRVQEYPRRRETRTHPSEESTHVEVGGPRVQFTSASRRGRAAPAEKAASEQPDRRNPYAEYDPPISEDDFELQYRHVERRYPEERPPSPPTRRFEHLRVRHLSPPPPNVQEEARGRDDSPTRRTRFQRVIVRGYSPPPREPVAARDRSPPRSMAARQRAPPLRPAIHRDSRPPPREQVTPERDEVTDSGSENPREVVEIRRFRGLDENGQPAMFEEHRRTVHLLEDDKEKEPALRQEHLYAGRQRVYH
ncbi:hypothetical protein BDV95DRAFT_303258 [Massariosphaeria phaeospora]|uniref:Uncharacterized protein n=1 Tax=Massariosphaeria phaeospora TaxID=100035 RepID=A0A7C8MU06_9PLEO|nr:hypothetical protein BDV95DRAFT_303258 [Massariosphaeria phaeospora]